MSYIGRTIDATPTVIFSIPISEGEARIVSAVVKAREAADAPSELAAFVRSGLFSRDIGGNVTLQGAVGGGTLKKTTETMACVMEANTTNQTVDVKVTGVAAKTLGWNVLVSEAMAAGTRDATLAGTTTLESGHYFLGDVAAKMAAASGSVVAKLYEDANNGTTVTRYGSTHSTKANRTEIAHSQGGFEVAKVIMTNGLITWQLGNGADAVDRMTLDATGHLKPAATNTQDLGSAALQYRAVYGVTAYLSDAQAARTTDTVFYSSDGARIYRNTAAGFRTSLGLGAGGPWRTGDAKLTIQDSPESGWVIMDDGTIGSAASGATTRANADCQALFELMWAKFSNTWAAVSGGRGGTAAADWAANKTIALPKVLGRALAVAGAGGGLTARALGEALGAETHQLTEAQMPGHTHPPLSPSTSFIGGGGSVPFSTTGAGVTVSATTGSAGGGEAHNNMQPTAFVNIMIKL